MENNKKHSLGHRAFLLFLSQRIKYPIYAFIVTGAAWYGERWIPVDYAMWGDFAVRWIFILSCVVLVLTILRTYMEYRYFTYMFTEEAFIMTYGAMETNEVATLYHQIQNVNLQRTLSDRSMGVSRLVVIMTGNERNSEQNKIVLPGLGKKKAKLVQKELLTRARHHIVPMETTSENQSE